MKIRLCQRFGLFMWAAGFSLACSVSSSAQQVSPQASTSRSPTPPQSASEVDTAVTIDQLLKKANAQMNAQGRMTEAEQTAQQAIGLSRKLGDNARTMRALLFLGSAYYYEGRLSDGMEIQQQAAALARETGDRKGLSRALNNIAVGFRDLGRYEDSLSSFYQVLDLARGLKDLPMQWTATRNVGVLYMQMGESDKARGPLTDALRIAYEFDNEPWKSTLKNQVKAVQEISLETLGRWEVERQSYAAGLNYFKRSLASKPDNPAITAEILDNMAAAYQRLGESQKSVEFLERAIRVWDSTGTPTPPAMVSDLGYSQEALGHFEQALETQERALALLHQGGGKPQVEWQFESRIAHVDRAMGRNADALAHYRNSIGILERLRAGALNTEGGRADILAQSRNVYAVTADLLVVSRRNAEALEIAERGRARAFLDMLALSRARLADELTPQEHKREDDILQHISLVQKKLWSEKLPLDAQRKLESELSSAENDLETFHLEVRESNPRYASVQYPQPITIGQIRDRLLDDHTALVEFLLGEKRSLVWVVTRDKLTTAVLPAQKQIAERVAAYRQVLANHPSALTVHQSLRETSRYGAELYRALLQPVEAALASSRTLIIVPDGVLNYLPFEALVSSSGQGAQGERQPSYLIERFAIVYGPSASALATVQTMTGNARAAPEALLAFGDPVVTSGSGSPAGVARNDATGGGETSVGSDYRERGFSFARLPYTRQEVLAISRLFPASQSQVFLGKEAREEAVKVEDLQDFRYIHFATHAYLDESNPSRSGILFSRDPNSSEDGILQMREIMKLKMNADLVTLSACSTGLGKLVNGEGILGLTRAFFYSGARNVTVSLWNVNDSATATLMTKYYQNLRLGLPKSAALRRAKLSLLQGTNSMWAHPYFWAAFVVVGEGK